MYLSSDMIFRGLQWSPWDSLICFPAVQYSLDILSVSLSVPSIQISITILPLIHNLILIIEWLRIFCVCPEDTGEMQSSYPFSYTRCLKDNINFVILSKVVTNQMHIWIVPEIEIQGFPFLVFFLGIPSTSPLHCNSR